jgi:hypothetical protein
MFGLFKKSAAGVRVVDKVWMSTVSKFAACAEMKKLNPQCLFVAWFEETRTACHEVLSSLGPTSLPVLAKDLRPGDGENKMVVFVEHHPLSAEEQKVYSLLNLAEVPVLSALDEAFFEKFGGAGTIEVMKRLGMNEHEVIAHPMINKAIHNAQEKIARKASGNLTAGSQAEWLKLNLQN